MKIIKKCLTGTREETITALSLLKLYAELGETLYKKTKDIKLVEQIDVFYQVIEKYAKNI